jgi:hypothetical protein
MTEIEPISDADLAAICAALDGLPETSERPYRGLITRIRRAEADNAQLHALVVSSGDTAQHWTDEAATYLQRAREAEAQLAALQAERAWRPIETARTAGHRRFLCWDAHYGLRIGTVHIRTDHDDWLSYMDGFGGSAKGGMRATHWMPLPSLPTEETDNG